MSTSQKDGDEPQVPPKSSQAVILLTLADTTWRMFVPSVGLTFVGLWLDGKWHTAPWLMMLGVVAGVLIAIMAVKLQIKKISKL
jgi:hypothetical protein